MGSYYHTKPWQDIGLMITVGILALLLITYLIIYFLRNRHPFFGKLYDDMWYRTIRQQNELAASEEAKSQGNYLQSLGTLTVVAPLRSGTQMLGLAGPDGKVFYRYVGPDHQEYAVFTALTEGAKIRFEYRNKPFYTDTPQDPKVRARPENLATYHTKPILIDKSQ